MHKMPDLLFLYIEMLTLRMATSTLLNFFAPRISYRFLKVTGVVCLGLSFAMIAIVGKEQVKKDEVHFLSISA